MCIFEQRSRLYYLVCHHNFWSTSTATDTHKVFKAQKRVKVRAPRCIMEFPTRSPISSGLSIWSPPPTVDARVKTIEGILLGYSNQLAVQEKFVDRTKSYNILNSAQYGKGAKPSASGIKVSSKKKIMEHVTYNRRSWQSEAKKLEHFEDVVMEINLV